MGTKLYCGNLSFDVSPADLENLFLEFGTVKSAEVVADRATGRSKGFGFVEMSSPAEAQAAIEGLRDKTLEGRPIRVSEAKPRENSRGRQRGGYDGGRDRRH